MNQLHMKLLAAAVAILLVGALGGYWIAQRRNDATNQDSTAQAGQGERKVLYWHDPMVPSARFDKPDKSPFMDMDLVPVYANEEGAAAVTVSSVVSQNLGIRLGTVERSEEHTSELQSPI